MYRRKNYCLAFFNKYKLYFIRLYNVIFFANILLLQSLHTSSPEDTQFLNLVPIDHFLRIYIFSFITMIS
jgi:hypothetical protein